jgi:hypothetical protein
MQSDRQSGHLETHRLNAIPVTGRGLDSRVVETVGWIESIAASDAILFVDAPLVVDNTGQRRCETEVGRRYDRWKVSANTTSLKSPGLAGVRLLAMLREHGWRYDDGRDGPPCGGRTVSECYPYTALVGVEELGYHRERPRYKRKPRAIGAGQWRGERAAVCDERRLIALSAVLVSGHGAPQVFGESAFQAAQRFVAGLALGDLPIVVGAAGAAAHPDLGDRGQAAARCRAALSCRSPPRERRWRARSAVATSIGRCRCRRRRQMEA